jgi:DNA repair protein RecO (recombination protein O)
VPDRDRIYRTEAVVLKHSDFGEADRLLTVYTPHLGKLRLLAKGVRKPTSRKAGHLESFTRTQLLVARGRNLDIVTQAQMMEPYLALRQDLWRTSHAYYVGELVDRFSEENAENPPLYVLLCDVLGWICQSTQLVLTMRFFELHLLGLVGYRPQLFHCVQCDAPLQPVANYFSAEDGGALCPNCGEARRGARPVPLGALKVLRYMQTHAYDDCAGLRLRPATHAALEDILQGYLVYILERRLKSVEFLNLLRHAAPPRPVA